ncbi:MAG: DUF4040 domain-containing protein [Cyanobacteria bacterium P01_F01_bin.3]
MTDDGYTIAITALLPLVAVMLVLQRNPYQALVIRGILGAIAALVYALYGAADVALTEALVGTMLSITLYAIAVRSSMTVRVGVLELDAAEAEKAYPCDSALLTLEKIFHRQHVRIELVPYPDTQALADALETKEIHITYLDSAPTSDEFSSIVETRVDRLYNILRSGVSPSVKLSYVGAD